MVMVFQNLIGNALKYRRIEVPQIRIEAVREETNWRVSVADNGQGFDRDYAETIFKPFRRLHGKNVPGSGIGLATCKRVIERLGGQHLGRVQIGRGFDLLLHPAGRVGANLKARLLSKRLPLL